MIKAFIRFNKGLLTALAGFTRLLLGLLGHVLWLPLLYYLWTRLGHVPADDFFGGWIRVLMDW